MSTDVAEFDMNVAATAALPWQRCCCRLCVCGCRWWWLP